MSQDSIGLTSRVRVLMEAQVKGLTAAHVSYFYISTAERSLGSTCDVYIVVVLTIKTIPINVWHIKMVS